MSNVADLSAKLLAFWGGVTSGNVLTAAGVDRPPTFLTPGAAGSAVYGRLDHSNTQNIIVVSVGVPVPLADASVQHGGASQITVGTLGTLTVDFASARFCEISAVVRIAATVGTVSVTINIEVNGAVVASDLNTSVGTGNGRLFKIVHTLTLNPGDVVRLSGQNNTNTTEIDTVGAFQNIESDGTSGQITFPENGFLVVAGVG